MVSAQVNYVVKNPCGKTALLSGVLWKKTKKTNNKKHTQKKKPEYTLTVKEMDNN